MTASLHLVEPLPAEAEVRTCSGCQQTLPVTAFNFYRKGKPARQRKCRKCKYAADKAATKAARAKYGRPAYARGKPITRWLSQVRARAKKLGLPFDLTAADIFIPEFCPVLGIKLERTVGHNRGFLDNSPSLDRLIPARGYVRGNVMVISGRANKLKNNATADELARVAAWMRSLGLA